MADQILYRDNELETTITLNIFVHCIGDDDDDDDDVAEALATTCV